MKFPRLFGRAAPVAETKASAVAATMVMSPGAPIWTPRDYEHFAREGYAQNVIAYQCINRIADAVASVDWLVKRGETETVCVFDDDDARIRHVHTNFND